MDDLTPIHFRGEDGAWFRGFYAGEWVPTGGHNVWMLAEDLLAMIAHEAKSDPMTLENWAPALGLLDHPENTITLAGTEETLYLLCDLNVEVFEQSR